MNDLRETVGAGVDARPDLSSGRGIFGDADDARDMGFAAGRQRPADQPGKLHKQPAGAAHGVFQDLADINGGGALSEALGKAMTDRRGKFGPFGFAEKGAKAKVLDGAAMDGRMVRS